MTITSQTWVVIQKHNVMMEGETANAFSAMTKTIVPTRRCTLAAQVKRLRHPVPNPTITSEKIQDNSPGVPVRNTPAHLFTKSLLKRAKEGGRSEGGRGGRIGR